MKGLLLKDWYLARTHCRAFLLILFVFAIVSAYSENNAFAVLYPIILSSILPVTLVSYDERSKWQFYADTMPYKRRDIVSVKYLVMLICLLFTTLIMGAVSAVKLLIEHNLELPELAAFIGTALMLGILPASLMLPVIFKFGVERGRIAYYAALGVVFACVFGFTYVSRNTGPAELLTDTFPFRFALPVAALLILGVSWLLSVKFYEKREL